VLELAEKILAQVGDFVYQCTRYGGHTGEQRW
jgi:hypothetical protein